MFLVSHPKLYVQNQESQRFSPIFSSRTLIVSGFMLDLLSHYILIFAYNLKDGSNFFCRYISSYYSNIWKDYSPLNCCWQLKKKREKQLSINVWISELPILFCWSICLSIFQYRLVTSRKSWNGVMLTLKLSSFSELLCPF